MLDKWREDAGGRVELASYKGSSEMPAIAYAHIEIGSDGVPILSGTTTKVIEVAIDRLAHHWDADEIQRQHPDLSLAQIHSALAYYYDHQSDLDLDIERRIARSDEILARVGSTALRAKLERSRLERTHKP